jgi:uncharacterized protein YpmB
MSRKKRYTIILIIEAVIFIAIVISGLSYLHKLKKQIKAGNGQTTGISDLIGSAKDTDSDEFDSDVDYGDETGISPVIQTIDADGTERYFDLSGRLLNGKPNSKGLYIKNAKKYIKK